MGDAINLSARLMGVAKERFDGRRRRMTQRTWQGKDEMRKSQAATARIVATPELNVLCDAATVAEARDLSFESQGKV